MRQFATFVAGAAVAALAVPLAAQTTAPAAGGAALFQDHCATCHAGSDSRIPPVAALRQRSAQSIVDALTSGVMRQQGEPLSEADRRAIAAFLAGTTDADPAAPAPENAGQCTTSSTLGAGIGEWRGWSPELDNSRFQSASRAVLTAAQIPRLTLKWAFGFPNATSARGAPTVYGGRVFVGSQDGTVYALDAKTGCFYWRYKAKAAVRSAIVIEPGTAQTAVSAYFGDERANVYALNAVTGELLWERPVEEHRSSRVTGAPTPFQGRLYVPVSSLEEGQGNNPKYECCTFRGSVVALNAANGALVWKTYTIDAEPRAIGTNPGGATRYGPAGAAIWSSPTVDRQRRLLYAATGNMYTEPQQATSDSVMAFELDTGRIRWTAQVTPKDVFVVGCNQPNGANCPGKDGLGPDFDFGSSPMLVTRPDGREMLVIGQKSGIGWALDPDDRGAVIWQYRAGAGSALGGMEWGSAVDGERAYFGVSDGNRLSAGELHAVQLSTGERAWRALPRPILCGEPARGCSPGILAALSVVPGAVFAGSLDGGIRAYSTADGSLLWEFDTNHEFQTVNSVPARGASINGPGPVIAGGMVYVNSGYGALGGRPGNVLLAFGVE